jgi:hypothetical protein
MTIEDFTNIDSVGLGTFRNGLHVTGGNLLVGRTDDYWSSRSVFQEDKDGRTHLLVKNDNNHASASAGITLNAFGNSWAIDCGSHPNNTNALTFGLDASAGSPAEKLRITSAGYVGINETSPDTYLHVKTGTDSALAKLEQTATNGRVQVQYLSPHGDWLQGIVGGTSTGDYLIYTGQSKNLTFYTSGTLRQKIQSDGKIILGGDANQTANRDLSVVAAQGNSNEAQIGLQPTNSSGGYNPEAFISAISDGTYGAHMYFKTRDTSGNRLERLRITSAGDIGIGEGTPLGKLHIKTGDSGASSVGVSADELVIEGSANSGMTILSGTSSEGLINFADSGDVNVGSIVYRHSTNSMQVKTADVERLSIKSTGDFHIAWNDGQFVGQYYDANYYMGLTFASNNRELYIDNKSNDTRADILLRTLQGSGTPVERLRVASDGNVTLGYGGARLYFQNPSNNSNSSISNGGGSNNSNLRFYTRSSGTEAERIRIQSDGNLIPLSNGANNLGLSGNKWDKVWTNYVRHGTRSATYERTFTATSDGSGNLTFECGVLWLIDDSSFEVFCHIDRTGSYNSIAARYKFYGSKVSGFGTQGTYRYDTSTFYIISPMSNPTIDAYTPSGQGSSHGTRIAHTGAAANAQYRLTMLINWVGQQEVT